jgi:hypothetical protein
MRWFGLPKNDERRLELYNLSSDLGETKNLVSAEPMRAAELDRLIDGFLRETGATFPRPNPAYVAGK